MGAVMTYVNQLASAGVAIASALGDVSQLLKISWLVLLAWAIGQVLWYRRGRVEVSYVAPVARKPVKRPRTPKKKTSAPADTTNAADLISAVGMSSQTLGTPADTYR